jgi:hypothetical protein
MSYRGHLRGGFLSFGLVAVLVAVEVWEGQIHLGGGGAPSVGLILDNGTVRKADISSLANARRQERLSCQSSARAHQDFKGAAQVGLLLRNSGGVRATATAEILIAGSKHIVKLCDELLTAARY